MHWITLGWNAKVCIKVTYHLRSCFFLSESFLNPIAYGLRGVNSYAFKQVTVMNLRQTVMLETEVFRARLGLQPVPWPSEEGRVWKLMIFVRSFFFALRMLRVEERQQESFSGPYNTGYGCLIVSSACFPGICWDAPRSVMPLGGGGDHRRLDKKYMQQFGRYHSGQSFPSSLFSEPCYEDQMVPDSVPDDASEEMVFEFGEWAIV